MNSKNDKTRMEAYLQAETKYRIVPVPTPVERVAAVLFVNSELSKAPDAETTEKLSRLAILHDLRETAKGFQAVLRLGEPAADDLLRSVSCLTALAWLGNDEQLAEIRRIYPKMLAKVDWDSQQAMVLRAAYSLGPKEPAETLKMAVRSALGSLDGRLRDLQHAKMPNLAEIEMSESRRDRLEEFLNLDIRRLEQVNGARAALEAQAEATRVSELCNLYLADSARATPAQSEWAAYKLVRLDGALHPTVAREFLALADLNDKSDPPRQNLIDMSRARSLRAAQYFGAILEAPARGWLAKQKDIGADVLALRPDWEYPRDQH